MICIMYQCPLFSLPPSLDPVDGEQVAHHLHLLAAGLGEQRTQGAVDGAARQNLLGRKKESFGRKRR